MSKSKRAVFPGMYIQGENVIKELPSVMKKLSGNKNFLQNSKKFLSGLLITAPSSMDFILSEILHLLPEGSRVVKFNRECCQSELTRLTAIVQECGARSITAIGGGKAIDAAKIVADNSGVPVIVVPTIASTDAPCSACAVIYSEDGVFERVHYQSRNPDAVIVDTSVIAKAPVRFLVSGMGDALATWFEARSCGQSGAQNECGGVTTMTALALAKLCWETLLEYGPDAKQACELNTVTPSLERIVEANTLLSGLGFESAGLSAAHSIHNGFTALKQTHAYYHGEKVAFGTLTGLHLANTDAGEMETVYGFCKNVGLPLTLDDLGLDNVSHDELMKVALRACAGGESIHHEPFPVEPEMVFDALLKADEFGKRYK